MAATANPRRQTLNHGFATPMEESLTASDYNPVMRDDATSNRPGGLFDLSRSELLLSSYYTLRPLRDAMAVGAGVENMKYLFLATFICMLAIVPIYGWVVSRFPRRQFLPLVYGFFIVNILAFRGAFLADDSAAWLARAFFVWVSVFNLFVVSVFWSFMADLFDRDQARRLFGLIAGGGSAGAILGPLLTSQLVERVGNANLLLVSATLLACALACLVWLIRHHRGTPTVGHDPAATRPIGGSIMAGFLLLWRHPFLAAVAAYMFLGTFTGALIYLQQAKVISINFHNPETITSIFAQVDLAINGLTILIQLTLTGRIVRWLGLATTLALLPAIALLGFGTITFVPAMAVIIVVQVLRRATLFSITNPASSMIYTVVGPESKYKFKHFTDTVVYRAGDTSSSWVFAELLARGAGLTGVALLGIGVSVLWAIVGFRVGRQFAKLDADGHQLP
jgi:AAA family ATP:ADP antiporter